MSLSISLNRLLRIASIPAAIAAALVLMLPRPAEACSCVYPTIELLQPAAGAAGVPVNARIWVGNEVLFRMLGYLPWQEKSPDVELRNESGAQVAVSESFVRGSDARVLVLTPEELLEEGGVYSVVLMSVDEFDAPAELVLSTFTVGSDLLEAPPSAPTVTVVETNAESVGETPAAGCGPFNYARLDITAPEGAVVIVVDEGDRAEVQPDIPTATGSSLSTGGTLTIGSGLCMEQWAEAAPGARTEVRAAAFDIAGNFSGFGEIEPVSLPRFGLSSCATAAGAAPWALLLVLPLVALAGRRRRRG